MGLRLCSDILVEDILNYGLFSPNDRSFVRPEPYLSIFLEVSNQTWHRFVLALENVTLQVLDILMGERLNY